MKLFRTVKLCHVFALFLHQKKLALCQLVPKKGYFFSLSPTEVHESIAYSQTFNLTVKIKIYRIFLKHSLSILLRKSMKHRLQYLISVSVSHNRVSLPRKRLAKSTYNLVDLIIVNVSFVLKSFTLTLFYPQITTILWSYVTVLSAQCYDVQCGFKLCLLIVAGGWLLSYCDFQQKLHSQSLRLL